MATFSVTQDADNGRGDTKGSLSWAIKSANRVAGSDTIRLETDVWLFNEMRQLIDSDITIEGRSIENSNGDSLRSVDGDAQYNISGNGLFRPLFVRSGNVVIQNTDIVDGLAKGIKGDHTAGGGAGLGGGLFIYSGNVTLSNVDLARNAAVGGDGGSYTSVFGSGGGFSPLFSGGDNAKPREYSGGNGEFGSGGGGGGFPEFRGGTVRDGGNGGLGGFGGGGGGAGAPDTQIRYSSGYNSSCYSGCYYSGEPGTPGAGGFGATDGFNIEYTGPTYSASGAGGAGAGLGGGIFIRTGQLNLENVDFVGNTATGGSSYTPSIEGEDYAQGLGGGLFTLHITENSNGNNAGMPDVLPIVNITSANFTRNTAASGASDSEESIGKNLDNNAVFGTTVLLTERNPIVGTNDKDKLVGTAGDDEISGLGGDDQLIGDRGNDILKGEGGNDVIKAGAGTDLLFGGRGNDKLFGGTGNDELTGFSGDDSLQGDAGNDFLDGGQGKDRLTGGRGDDELIGGTGNDFISGGSGNDRLVGGEGRDVLTGGSGRDTFVIASGGRLPVRDVISDFRSGQDQIEVLNLSFGQLSFKGNKISIAETNEVIAALTGIDTTTLTAADFV